jgi:MFS transporter, UMF1 family
MDNNASQLPRGSSAGEGAGLRQLLNRQNTAWVLYDFANSAFALLIAAVGFPLYFKTAVYDGAAKDADAIWSLTVAISLAIAGVLAPFLGAFADIGERRHRLFVATTVIVCMLSAGLALPSQGDVVLAVMLFGAAQVSYTVAQTLYDSYLRRLVSQDKLPMLSGIGWGFGYIGGILCFALCYPLLKGGLTPENVASYRWAFVLTAAFYLLFALPAFLLLPRGRANAYRRFGDDARKAYASVWNTLRNWRAYRSIMLFLAAYYCLSDGIVTIVYFTALYLAGTWEYSVTQILGLTLVVQALGFPTTVVFGWLGRRWSLKGSLLITNGVWVLAVLVMAFGTAPSTPLLMACLLGLVIGATQSLCRATYAVMVPEEEQSKFFGFNACASKVSAVVGPLLFGLIVTVTESQRMGMLSLLVFFVAGSSMIIAIELPKVADRRDCALKM